MTADRIRTLTLKIIVQDVGDVTMVTNALILYLTALDAHCQACGAGGVQFVGSEVNSGYEPCEHCLAALNAKADAMVKSMRDTLIREEIERDS